MKEKLERYKLSLHGRGNRTKGFAFQSVDDGIPSKGLDHRRVMVKVALSSPSFPSSFVKNTFDSFLELD